MKKIIQIWGVVFMLFAMISIPFPFHFISFITTVQRYILFPTVEFTASALGLTLQLTDLSSDSVGLYLLISQILILALFAAFWISNNPRISSFFSHAARSLAPYYLSLILLKYGLDKIFMVQFPQPGPNLLHTPLGYQDKDILFWSVMGLSKGYMIFTGVAEIIPGLLLLFRRTRIFGAVLSLGIFIHILALNLSFDISVKLYSTFLLILSIYIAFPFLKWLYQIFIVADPINYSATESIHFKGKAFLKLLAYTVIVLELFTPYLANSSKISIPNLAFEIKNPLQKTDRIGNLYLHEDGFLIIQSKEYNSMIYPILSFSLEQEFLIIEKSNRLKTLSFKRINDYEFEITHPEMNVYISCHQLETKNLPALKDHFHWTVDELVVQ